MFRAFFAYGRKYVRLSANPRAKWSKQVKLKNYRLIYILNHCTACRFEVCPFITSEQKVYCEQNYFYIELFIFHFLVENRFEILKLHGKRISKSENAT